MNPTPPEAWAVIYGVGGGLFALSLTCILALELGEELTVSFLVLPAIFGLLLGVAGLRGYRRSR